ncbi:hypothetical protein GCM10009782_25700 [Glycomyces algeriensis]
MQGGVDVLEFRCGETAPVLRGRGVVGRPLPHRVARPVLGGFRAVPVDPPQVRRGVLEPGEGVAEEVGGAGEDAAAALLGAGEHRVDIVHVDAGERGRERPVGLAVGDGEQ